VLLFASDDKQAVLKKAFVSLVAVISLLTSKHTHLCPYSLELQHHINLNHNSEVNKGVKKYSQVKIEQKFQNLFN